jgi:hypothetical protein
MHLAFIVRIQPLKLSVAERYRAGGLPEPGVPIIHHTRGAKSVRFFIRDGQVEELEIAIVNV